MFNRFRAEKSGSVLVIFALSFLVLIGAIGLAIDYARAVEARSRLQAAVDSTALALAHADRDMSEADLNALANSILAQNFPANPDILDGTLDVQRGKDFISVTSTAEIKTILMNVLGIRSTSIAAEGQAIWGSVKLEVALVLDNSGSMADDNRLVELKKAAKELINILEDAAFEPGTVKIGLVPFASSVRVQPATYKNANWIRFDEICSGSGRNRRCNPFDKDGWDGCLKDRDKNYDVTDGDFSSATNATKYPAIELCPTTGSSKTNENKLGYITPLSENFDSMRTAVDAMRAGGYTNLTIGIAMGMSILSHQAPFTEGVDPSIPTDQKTEKIIIALSDGENTRNGHGDSKNTINTRNKQACTNAKAAGIYVYTILLVDGDKNLLTQCASPSGFELVEDAAKLLTTFRTIGAKITKLRLGK